MIPQLPMLQSVFRFSFATAEPFAKGIDERVEIIVFDDECTLAWMIGVVAGQHFDHLHPQGRFAAPLFPENNRRGRGLRRPENLVPSRMMRAVEAVLTKHMVRLSVFLGEGIFRNSVMVEELVHLHWTACLNFADSLETGLADRRWPHNKPP